MRLCRLQGAWASLLVVRIRPAVRADQAERRAGQLATILRQARVVSSRSAATRAQEARVAATQMQEVRVAATRTREARTGAARGTLRERALAFDPRVSAEYRVSAHLSLKSAIGVAHQPPASLVPTPGLNPTLGQGLQTGCNRATAFGSGCRRTSASRSRSFRTHYSTSVMASAWHDWATWTSTSLKTRAASVGRAGSSCS